MPSGLEIPPFFPPNPSLSYIVPEMVNSVHVFVKDIY